MLKSLLFSAAVLLPITALAAPVGVTLSPNKAITSFHGAPSRPTLPQWIPPINAYTIINTFAALPTTYNCCSGWTVSNLASAAGTQQWIAYPITTGAAAPGLKVVEAVGYVSSASSAGDSVTIALYSDTVVGGIHVPGKLLAKKRKTTLETFGLCCIVATADLDVPVTAATAYWVAAILQRADQSTTWDAWNFSTTNTNTVPFAFYNGTWNLTSGSYAAFAVYGQ